MNSEIPPIADPHSTSPVPRQSQPQTIAPSKGVAALFLLMMGCFLIACSVSIIGAVIATGVLPVIHHTVGPIDPVAVVGSVFIAIFGAVCGYGGFLLLRQAVGNQRLTL